MHRGGKVLAVSAALAVLLTALAGIRATGPPGPPSWTPGDVWVYANDSGNVTKRVEVIGEEDIPWNGTTHRAYRTTILTVISPGGPQPNETTLTTAWWRVRDLALVRAVIEDGLRTTVDVEPPLEVFRWPLAVGAPREQTVMYVRDVAGSVSYTAYRFQHVTESVRRVAVPAGAFDALRVRSEGRNDSGGGASLVAGAGDYAPDVGNFAVVQGYFGGAVTLQLTDYRFRGAPLRILGLDAIATALFAGAGVATALGVESWRRTRERRPDPAPGEGQPPP